MKNGNIAIDGPVSSGKSTISKLLAKKLKKRFISTGSIYRAIAYLGFENNIDLKNEEKIVEISQNAKISFDPNGDIIINGKVVIDEIRTEEVSSGASIVAAYEGVREALKKIQQDVAAEGNAIMEGRDIGTVIMPEAQYKIFLNCDYKVRAKRRFKENQSRKIECSLEEIEKSIQERDHQDRTRKISPLIKAKDAIEVDSTHLSIEEVVEKIISLLLRS